jgi:hypothetical protein
VLGQLQAREQARGFNKGNPALFQRPLFKTLYSLGLKQCLALRGKQLFTMNLNLSASVNIFKLLAKPSLCLPHATISTFEHLPVPLDQLLAQKGRAVDIRAVVLDKDDCFAYPDKSEVYDAYKVDMPPDPSLFLFLSILSFANLIACLLSLVLRAVMDHVLSV